MSRKISPKTVVRIVMLCSLLLFISALAVVSSAPAQAQTNWVLQWSDEFNGSAGSGVNTGNWLYDTGTCYPGCPGANWGTGEVESMTTSTANVFQDGAGHLAINPILSGGNWTSGRIETQRTDFQPPPGGIMRVEASIQQPNVSGAAAAGYWPAFWMLGAPFRGVYTNWPSIGEIDILEDINGLSSVFGTLHCGVAPGGPCNEFTGIGSGQHACAGCQTGFHTYAVQYDRSVSPEQLRWYLDGVNYFTINANQVDATTWSNATNHGFFVIFDLAMGGGFPAAFGGGPTSTTVSGIPMLVDYVRVYYAAGSGSTATNPPPPTNTPVGPTHTSVPSSPTPTTSNTGNGNALYLLGGATTTTNGALSFAAGNGAGADSIPSASGGNHDGAPTNQLTYVINNVSGTYNAAATQFNLYVDSAANVGNGLQARVSYDFTGDGTWDRVETYHYFATDPVTGWEDYAQNSAGGLESSSGAFANLNHGNVKVEVWSAIGSAASTIRTGATVANGQQSALIIPFTSTVNTSTPVPPTATPTKTATPLPPTTTPTKTSTPPPPTNTPTKTTTPLPPTATSTKTATPLPPTNTPTNTASSALNAYNQNKATSANTISGGVVETCTDTGGGQDVGQLANGNYLVFNSVDFGKTPAINVSMRVASGATGGISGLVQVWIDGMTSGAGTELGDFSVANTGGWQSWTTVPANVSGVTGIHKLYVVLSSGQPNAYVSINWIQFVH